MPAFPRILVLMGARDGQAYLNQQLKSILAQQGVEVAVRACDDGSSDSTYRILETFAQDHPNIQPRYHAEPAGAWATLSELVQSAEADDFDYFAFSDQKDAWHAGKLAAAVRHISSNTSRPELYYANVRDIDERGQTIGLGQTGVQELAEHPESLLVVPNWAPGCTMVMNRALVKLLRAHPTDEVGRPYEAWVHATALYCGGFVYADHARHVASRRTVPGLFERERPDSGFSRMAGALVLAYPDDLTDEAAPLVHDVAEMGTNLAARLRLSRRKGIVAESPAATRALRRALLLNRL